ncbi:NAD(P)-binding protein [Podospora fimiseda]|uniref:3-dehydrosphinganine reductase n=1 Tax=Podospora fimiseda TaxID=252190 RepID=A0AAN7H1J1_9PEZI|nr:NAD(P)-binding protein [Podospora fimiseda]
MFWSKKCFVVQGRTVLITGGSTGLGLSAAKQLAAKGANIIIVARDVAKLETAKEDIKNSALSETTQRFHHIVADVTSPEACSTVVAEATKWNNDSPPDIVWCCSGSAHPSLFIDTPIDQFQKMMDSNYFSCVYMAHEILNVWLRSESTPAVSSSESRPSRHLIFTASFVSFFSFAGFTPYSPSKAATRSLSDSLSQEMNLYAAAHPELPLVRVHTVFPATMPTQSLTDENKVKTDLTKSLEEGDQVLTPDECARRAIKGLENGRELVPTSGIIHAVMTSMLGGSIRGGFVTGLLDTMLGWAVMLVMVFVRWEMDKKVRIWGKRYGSSGMKESDE